MHAMCAAKGKCFPVAAMHGQSYLVMHHTYNSGDTTQEYQCVQATQTACSASATCTAGPDLLNDVIQRSVVIITHPSLCRACVRLELLHERPHVYSTTAAGASAGVQQVASFVLLFVRCSKPVNSLQCSAPSFLKCGPLSVLGDCSQGVVLQKCASTQRTLLAFVGACAWLPDGGLGAFQYICMALLLVERECCMRYRGGALQS
jgi:hypothetical protein